VCQAVRQLRRLADLRWQAAADDLLPVLAATQVVRNPSSHLVRSKIAQGMYDSSGHTVQQIADEFGVSRPTI
jgi:hypothetical protein